MTSLSLAGQFCNQRLWEDHWRRHLRPSGITRWAARACGVYSVTDDEARALTGLPWASSGLVFPHFFPGHEEPLHHLVRLDRPLGKAKYVAPIGSRPHLYLPPLVAAEQWGQPGSKALIEGCKKAVVGSLYLGVPTVGISGVWGGLDGLSRDGLAYGFDHLSLQGPLIMMYDSDICPQHPAFVAYIRQAGLLMARGARPTIVTLPVLPGIRKTGLDDWFKRFGPAGRVPLWRFIRLHPALQPTAADTGRAAVEILAAAPEPDRPLAVEAPALWGWLAALAYDDPPGRGEALDRLRAAGWPMDLLEKLEERVAAVLEAAASMERLLAEYEGWIVRPARPSPAPASPATEAPSAKIPTPTPTGEVLLATPTGKGRAVLDDSFQPEARPTCGAAVRRFRRRMGSRVLELHQRLFCGRWDCPRCRRRFTASWLEHLDGVLSQLQQVGVGLVRDERGLDALAKWVRNHGGDYFRVLVADGFLVFSNLDITSHGAVQGGRLVPSHEARGLLARQVRGLAVNDGHRPFAASRRWQKRDRSLSQGWELVGVLALSPEEVKALASSPQAASLGVRIRREGPDRLLLELPAESEAAWEQVLTGGGTTALPQAA